MSGDRPGLYEMLDDRFRPGRCLNGLMTRWKSLTGLPLGRGADPRAPWRQVIWSEIPDDRMLRRDEETGAVSVFRRGAGHLKATPRPPGPADHLPWLEPAPR